MAERSKLNVSYSETALKTLDQIQRWNVEHYGLDHAKRYIQFLLDATEQLATSYLSGRAVPGRAAFRYILIRRRRRGHGHVAVYKVAGDSIIVLDYFHTAQDWQSRLSSESK